MKLILVGEAKQIKQERIVMALYKCDFLVQLERYHYYRKNKKIIVTLFSILYNFILKCLILLQEYQLD